jgi:hypothetical protein
MKAKYGTAIEHFAGRVASLRHLATGFNPAFRAETVCESEMSPEELIYHFWRFTCFLENQPPAAVSLAERCQSRHADMQCIRLEGHMGDHQAGNECWSHV